MKLFATSNCEYRMHPFFAVPFFGTLGSKYGISFKTRAAEFSSKLLSMLSIICIITAVFF